MSQPKIPKIPMPPHFKGMMPDNTPQFALNPRAFDELIGSKGIRMVHSKPIPCPNVSDLHSGDHPPGCSECQEGMIYYDEKEFIGAFQGNSNSRQHQVNGQFDYDEASVVVPAKYKDGSEFDIQLFDRIVVPDFTVRFYQRVEHSQTGVDRLKFPAVRVDKLRDASGNEYRQGIDFELTQTGDIKWISQNRPGYNLGIKKGVVYSVNFYCRPVFTIVSLPHQLRATQTVDPSTGRAVQERFPQQAVVRKDFVPYHGGDRVGPTDTPEPRDGQF